LGYLFLMKENSRSAAPAEADEPHFKIRSEWQNTSYIRRVELFCLKLVREQLYNAAYYLTSRGNDDHSRL